MDKEKKITKIVIDKEDELTDIVTAILEATNERIVLTFAEESDLLISPINLKVLLETADEYEKLLIAQIIKNPTGIRNANLAGITAIDTPTFPPEETWEKEEYNRGIRLNPPKKDTPPAITEEKEPEVSDFEKRVDEAIAKSQNSKPQKDNEDFLISLDEDLPIENEEALLEEPLPENHDLSKVDFSEKTEDPTKTIKERKVLKPFRNPLAPFFASIKEKLSKIPFPTKFKKLLPLIGISVVLLTVLVGFIYMNTAVFVKVKIYVEAKDVEIEQIFEGDENIKEIDFESFKIPVKTETVEKSRSTNIKATGKAYKGEKAKGKVNITYIKEGCSDEVAALQLSSGTTLSTGGKVYTLDADTSVKCTTLTVAQITAIEVGEEYNIASGQLFTFQGYSSNQLLALNNSGAITGGSKEEYTVLSKADVDNAVEELSKIAEEEGESELKNKQTTWKIIDDSIKSEVVPDSTKTDVAIGSQANEVNLSMKTKSTATYFLKEGFDDGVSKMLTDKAKENNLFETDKDWDLELDKDISKEISVVESNSQGIKIKLIAKSSVKPKVNKEDILEELKEKDWKSGQDYLKSLEFSDKETRIEFIPENFPEWLRSFPKRRGGVMITVVNVN